MSQSLCHNHCVTINVLQKLCHNHCVINTVSQTPCHMSLFHNKSVILTVLLSFLLNNHPGSCDQRGQSCAGNHSNAHIKNCIPYTHTDRQYMPGIDNVNNNYNEEKHQSASPTSAVTFSTFCLQVFTAGLVRAGGFISLHRTQASPHWLGRHW